jgi:hypothetical protein
MDEVDLEPIEWAVFILLVVSAILSYAAPPLAFLLNSAWFVVWMGSAVGIVVALVAITILWGWRAIKVWLYTIVGLLPNYLPLKTAYGCITGVSCALP